MDMSLVFNINSRDVPADPKLSLGLDHSAPTSNDHNHHQQQPQQDLIVVALTSPSFFTGGVAASAIQEIHPSANDLDKTEESSDSSSSIGVPSDNDDDSEEEDSDQIRSKSHGSLTSFASLEDSLPIKRGLSSYFCGKSKSFASLSDAKSVKEMEKQENPLNKKRRLMIVSKWSKKKSFYSWKNPTSMPLLALHEEDEETNDEQRGEEEEEDDSSNENEQQQYTKKRNYPKGFHSCFNLTDL